MPARLREGGDGLVEGEEGGGLGGGRRSDVKVPYWLKGAPVTI